MKANCLPLLLVLLILNIKASTFIKYEEFSQVNPYWKFHFSAFEPIANKRERMSDRELIKAHLRLVEKALRSKVNSELNERQKKRRLQLLDVLHFYTSEGVFPKNTEHLNRTPYFIDSYGTACAVGYLIIESGNGKLAQQISRETNNGYIFELVVKYPQIKDWADENGFTIDELAWIQPCYEPPVDTAGLKQPSCHSAYNGYFCPDFSTLQAPLTKSFYHLVDTNWVAWVNMCSEWRFNSLNAGKYKWIVKDSLNVTHTYTTELVAPAPAIVSTLSAGDFNSCEGVITVSAQGGTLPYDYSWWRDGGITKHTSVLDSICEELVYVSFYENSTMCPQYFNFEFRHVGLQENNLKQFQLSPNPVNDLLKIKFDQSLLPSNRDVTLTDIYGRIVLRIEIESETNVIRLDGISKGIYFLKLDGYKTQRILKE